MKSSCLLIIAFLLANCTGTKHSEADSIRYSEFTSFTPQSLTDINGCYYSNHGFGGTLIVLNEDSSHYFNMWTDLYDESDPVVGYEGNFVVDQDSLFFNFTQLRIDSSKDSSRIAEIKDREKEYIEELMPFENWLFKRIGNNIFLVTDRMNYHFGQFSIENHGIPQVNKRNGRRYGEYFPLKMSVSSCSEMVSNL